MYLLTRKNSDSLPHNIVHLLFILFIFVYQIKFDQIIFFPHYLRFCPSPFSHTFYGKVYSLTNISLTDSGEGPNHNEQLHSIYGIHCFDSAIGRITDTSQMNHKHD